MLNIKHPLYQQDLSVVADIIKSTDISGARILITGASGMIGSFIADVFTYYNNTVEKNRSVEIYLMARNEKRLAERFSYCDKNLGIHLLPGDVRETISKEIKFDYILHAASNTHPLDYASDPIGTITTNIMGLYNLLSHAAKFGTRRLLFFSTVEIYGENKDDIGAFNESDCGYIDCNSLRAGYPESKRLCESMCQAFIKEYNMDIVISRVSRTYGPTMLFSDSKASSQLIKKALDSENIVLKSNGEQIYSYVYVADVVYAALFILLNGVSGEAYNITGKDSKTTLKELAEYCANVAKTKVVFELPSAMEKMGFSQVTKAVLNTSKLRALGWVPMYSVAEGLERTFLILKDKKE